MGIIQNFQDKAEAAIVAIDTGSGPRGLVDPIAYVLSLGGKRLRPALSLAGCGLFDRDAVDNCMPAAVALELFHNFTLVHDDLMDKATYRRNHLTVHKKWDINTAILSGDAIFILAYQWLAQVPMQSLPRVLQVFNRTAMEVCSGQQHDMDFEARDNVTEELYIEMIRLKTAVLIGASLGIGAIIGNANDHDQEMVTRFGTGIGISFQLQDDWLDVFGNSDKFGKEIGGDIVSNKKTYLLINALNNLAPAAKKELLKWIGLREFNREEKVQAVRALFEEAGSGIRTRQLMDKYLVEALSCLDKIKNGDEELKTELKSFVSQLMERSR